MILSERSRARRPSSMRFTSSGSLPAAESASMRSQVAPSTPTRTNSVPSWGAPGGGTRVAAASSTSAQMTDANLATSSRESRTDEMSAAAAATGMSQTDALSLDSANRASHRNGIVAATMRAARREASATRRIRIPGITTKTRSAVIGSSMAEADASRADQMDAAPEISRVAGRLGCAPLERRRARARGDLFGAIFFLPPWRSMRRSRGDDGMPCWCSRPPLPL
jgi:hypothetical protein